MIHGVSTLSVAESVFECWQFRKAMVLFHSDVAKQHVVQSSLFQAKPGLRKNISIVQSTLRCTVLLWYLMQLLSK